MDNNAVVIDNGTGLCKAGIAGDEAPSSCFPACVGRPNFGTIIGADSKKVYVGTDAIAKKGLLSINYPIEHGRVNNWDDMTKIWNHCYYNELRVDPSEQPVHLTEAPKNPKQNREQMMQIFFEEFSVPAFYISIQAVLSLYSTGRTTGVVLDSGDGVTHIVPVYEAYSLRHAVKRLDLAGRDLTHHLKDILSESSISLTGSTGFEIARDIKEAKCYVALDFEEEMSIFEQGDSKDTEWELPDGEVVKFGDQQIRCPEVLFQPKMLGKDYQGVHHHTYQAIQMCDVDLRRELANNISLSGGTTCFPGIQDRLTKEVAGLAPSNVKVKVIAANERKYSVWIGGGVLSTLSSFQTCWVQREEYDEAGASLVHRKCF